jgi:hypothetical protein
LTDKDRNKIRGKATGIKFVDYGKRSTQPPKEFVKAVEKRHSRSGVFGGSGGIVKSAVQSVGTYIPSPSKETKTEKRTFIPEREGLRSYMERSGWK